MHQPADIDGELLRLGAGQQGAVVQRLQEALLADPLLLLDDDAMHHRDLAGRAAEGERGDARPDLHRLAEGNAMVCHLLVLCWPPAGKGAVEIVENGAAALQALVVVGAGRGDAGDQAADAGRFLAAVLAVLQVDVVDDLADRGQRRIVETGLGQQHLEGAAVAVVRELALEHVEAQLARLRLRSRCPART